jgi:hypothetical protein
MGRLDKAIGQDELAEGAMRFRHAAKLAQTLLGAHFPRTGDADQDLVGFVGDRRARRGAELRVVCPPPQQDMGVNQEVHQS